MFSPPRCPSARCRFHERPSADFFVRDGAYRAQCRNQPVPRFRCRGCGKRFSRQTFRADHQQKKPHLNTAFFHLMVSCVGQRQAARCLGVARKTVERRFRWLAAHARLFHQNQMRSASLHGPFQLDELESFESNRFQPVTVPILIDRSTFFVVASAVGPLRRKGRMTPRQREQRRAHEARFGRRPSSSGRVVAQVLERLEQCVPRDEPVVLDSDRKPLYGWLGRQRFGARFVGRTHDASARRDRANPLFPINHTNARLRHFLSRLRRRTWCVSKRRQALAAHLDIATLWINYARGITNRTATTPAQALGVAARAYTLGELLSWRQDLAEREANGAD